MRLNDTETYLSLALRALDESVLHAADSSNVRPTAELIKQCLLQLQVRRRVPVETLRQTLAEAHSIRQDLIALARTRGIPIDDVDDERQCVIDGFEDYQLEHGRTSARLAALARSLSKARKASGVDQELAALLRRAAEWEAAADVVSLPPETATDSSEKSEALPREAFEAFVRGVHEDGARVRLASTDRVAGGFGKQTFFVTVLEANGRPRQLVVRKDDGVRYLFHPQVRIDREFSLVSSLFELGLAVPRPLWMGNGIAGIDADFYVMDRLPGKPLGALLDGGDRIPETVALEMAEHLAKLHSVTPSMLPGFVSQFDPALLSPDETVESVWRRRIAGWRHYSETIEHSPTPMVEYLLDWLETHVADASSPLVLTHGDFNIHNVLSDGSHVTGILDWEFSIFGSSAKELLGLKPNISQHISWEKFCEHYLACGGKALEAEDTAFYRAYAGLQARMAASRVALNLQNGTATDIRFANFELGFNPMFARRAVTATAQSTTISTETWREDK